MRKPVHPAVCLENVLAEIHDAERILLKVQSSEGFRALTYGQLTKYEGVISGLRGLIYDIERGTTQAWGDDRAV